MRAHKKRPARSRAVRASSFASCELRRLNRDGLLLLRRVEQRRARNLIAAVRPDESDALRASAGLAYLAGLDAYELALLRDDHQLRLFIDGEDCDDLSGLVGRLHVDDALSATRLQAVGRYRGLLAKAALTDREHLLAVV